MNVVGTHSFTERMIGAARLDVDIYEEVEADTTATMQAAGVVAIVALASAIGGIGDGTQGAIGGLLGAIVGWLLWAGITRDVAPYRSAVLGPLFAAGGVGGAVVPWLVGAVSDAGAGLAAALLVPLAALVIVLALLPVAWRKS